MFVPADLLIKHFPAVRTVTIDQGAPWGEVELERSMMPLKWYHDLCCEMAEYSYAFGPCWEPVIAQCNLGMFCVANII